MPRSLLKPSDIQDDDIAACREMLRCGSRSFYAASFLLPRRLRDPAIALYAFCRLADDAIDGADAAPDARDQLADRLANVYAGTPSPHPADRAFANVVARFAIPRAIPMALLEGLTWDAQGKRYESFAELCAYAARVAGTVGAMMALIMGQRDPEVLAYACDLGVAMQLTNIARDVGEDARAGRLYLPRDWMREAGIDPDRWMGRPDFAPDIGVLVARLLHAADMFYDRGRAGIARLPLDCRFGIYAAQMLYAEIGREAERAGCDTISKRAVVSAGRKLQLLLRACGAPLLASNRGALAPIAETRFIVEAVIAATASAPTHAGASWWPSPDKAIWVIDLFERLERLDQDSRAMSAYRARRAKA